LNITINIPFTHQNFIQYTCLIWYLCAIQWTKTCRCLYLCTVSWYWDHNKWWSFIFNHLQIIVYVKKKKRLKKIILDGGR